MKNNSVVRTTVVTFLRDEIHGVFKWMSSEGDFSFEATAEKFMKFEGNIRHLAGFFLALKGNFIAFKKKI